VGNWVDAEGKLHGFLLNMAGFTLIDIPNALYTEALGINNHGQIVGFYLDANLRGHGFLWHNGTSTTIDAPNALFNTVTEDLNTRGQIVGFYDSFGGRTSFLLDGGQFTSLDVGSFPTSALGINSRGQIVGEYVDGSGKLRGFLLTPIQ
jgi:probable HAF family extracellular repeat protein